MTDPARVAEGRVLILAPSGRDAALAHDVFTRAGIAAHVCSDLVGVCAELDAGAGALLIAEESTGADRTDPLTDWLARQPPWSDLPVLMLARPGADSAAVARAVELLGNVTVLERPVRIAALVTGARTALRSRDRQYQTRQHLLDREQTAAELRTLMDLLPVGVVIAHDPACRRITGNRAGNAILRMPAASNLSRTAPPLERPTHFRPSRDGAEIPPDQLPVQRAARGEIIRNEEVDQVFDDGTVVHTLISAFPLFDAAGNSRGAVASITDITTRKRAEAQLRRSHDTFFNLIENAPFGVYVVDAAFRLRQVSAGAQAVFANVRPLLGRDFADVLRVIWPEAFAAEVVGRFRHTLATGEPYAAPDTTERRGDVPAVESYDWKIERLTLPDGSFGVVCYFYDITARKQAEAALRAVAARQAYLVRLADALRPLSDPAAVPAAADRVLGEHLGANRVAYFEIVGPEYVVERDYADGVGSLAGRYPVASFGAELLDAFLAGRTVIEADATTQPGRPPEERAAFAAIGVRGHVDVPLVKAGAFVAGMTVHCREPREWTADEVALIEETAERTWAAVERTKTERALRASEERRRLALESAELGAWQIDLATMTLTADDRFRAVFGLGAGPLDYEPAVAAIHPDDRDRVRAAVAAATRPTDPEPYAVEYRVVHPGGAVRWVYAKGRVNFAGAGPDRRLASFDGTVADVTDRKRMEDDLRRAVADLSDADRRKNEFLAMLAHELRNPLAPIRNSLHILRLVGGAGPEVAGVHDMMDRQVAHMVRLVDDLLEVSRITRGKIDLRRKPIDLAAVLRTAVETSRPLIDAANHALTVDVPAELLVVDGDAVRLAQVFANLLNNAAKYTDAGGAIHLCARRCGADAVVSVRDTGAGIPAEMLGRVFELFTQLDRSDARAQGGLGIGLTLVKSLVELHGGRVAVRSDGPGTGSEFEVRLPVLP